MQNKTVQDIMVPIEEYPCIPDTLTIGDAVIEMTVQILRQQRLSLPRAALVFDEDFRDLRGMVRRRDIMRGLEPRFLVGGSLDYQRKLFDIKVDPNLSELSYDTIMQRVWGGQFRGESNVLAVTVSTVRKALEEEGEPRLIQTVRGVGDVLRPSRGRRHADGEGDGEDEDDEE